MAKLFEELNEIEMCSFLLEELAIRCDSSVYPQRIRLMQEARFLLGERPLVRDEYDLEDLLQIANFRAVNRHKEELQTYLFCDLEWLSNYSLAHIILDRIYRWYCSEKLSDTSLLEEARFFDIIFGLMPLKIWLPPGVYVNNFKKLQEEVALRLA